LIVVVVVMIRVIGVTAMVVPVIGRRVPDGCTPDAADPPANDSAGDGAADRSSNRASFVGKGDLRRGE
jgi:hypothetical protein